MIIIAVLSRAAAAADVGELLRQKQRFLGFCVECKMRLPKAQQ
ncbi:MAG TPA: hypothetical protein VGH81_06575 [Rudaea sp.]|jgi:hypothetical protein